MWSRDKLKRLKCDKTGEVRVTLHRGGFVKALLLWESSECSILWVCLCSFGQQHAKHLRLSRSTTFFPTLPHKWHGFRGVTARELQYLTLVFGTHHGVSTEPSLNIAALISIIIPVWIEAVLVLCHEFKLAFFCCVFTENDAFYRFSPTNFVVRSFLFTSLNHQ